MTLKKAARILNKKLEVHNPKTFSSSWIFKHTQSVYNYVRLNHKTEHGTIDWDAFTPHLDKYFQRRWTRYRRKPAKPYENQGELDLVLNKYKDKLYTFVAPSGEEDREIRNKIIISIVRIAQKGNTLAEQELVKWITYITEEWVEKYYQIFKWKGYPDEVEDKIRGCIRCYKYTGSFVGYLFKTLEYSARGKPPQCSLDDKLFDGTKTRIDFVAADTSDLYL